MRIAILGLCLVCVGCEPGAEVIVEIHTDLEPGIDFDGASATVGGARARDGTTRDGWLGGVRLPSVRVSPGPAEVGAALELGGSEVVARSVSIRAAGTVVVPVWLVRGCVGLRCPTGGVPMTWTECDGGRCVAPDCVPTEGEGCGIDACADDADCPPPAAACAEARCDLGNCTVVTIAGECTASEYCDPDAGCTPRTGGSDGGTPDGGARDAGGGCGACDAGGGCGACDDGNPCTDDVCSGTTCTHPENGAGCDDGNACTHDDHCSGGSCRGTGYSCTPPPCMTSSCDGSGGCSVGGGCGGGTVCDGSGCVACGGADQRCCDSGGCNSGLWCFTGVCTCGQPGGPCCPWDGSCAAGTCAGGTCPTCLPDGASCGSLPCCTGRCASGICFPF